jgi:hypothetical protein
LVGVKQGEALVEKFLKVADGATLQEHVPVGARRTPRCDIWSRRRALERLGSTAALPQDRDLLGLGGERH